MAFQLSGGVGGRRSRGLPAMADINVTPFVDVALVLLIIFMITAHVMEYGIDVEVPKTKSVAASASLKEQPVVVISAKGETYLGSSPVSLVRMVSEIHNRYPGQTAVYIRAAGTAPWEEVAQVASELSEGKFGINFVTKPDDSRNRR